MKRWLLLMILIPAGCLSGWSQRLFSFEVDSLTRSYLLVEASDYVTANLPVIIILHDKRVMPTNLARMEWSRLKHPCVMAFPVALRNQWACLSHTDSLKADKEFLLRLIFQIQNNFRTDPSRVFIIGMGSSFCLADAFAKEHTSLIRAAIHWKNNYSLRSSVITEPAPSFDSLVSNNPGVAIPKNDTVQFAFEQNSKHEKVPYAKHTTLAFHVGRWQQAKVTRTDFDSLTMTDLAEYHFQFGLELGYHFSERWSAFVGCDFTIIPKKREVNNISWGGGQGVRVKASGKGGIVIPYSMGLRYTIPRENFRPFVSASVGSTFFYIGGGKASGGTGGLNKTIVKRNENVFRYTLGTGFDLRVSPMTSLELTSQYAFSSKIDPPLASVNRFQGLSFMIGLLFILNNK